MFGFTDQPAAPTATEEPVATAGDDMFGFGLESDAHDATVQPQLKMQGLLYLIKLPPLRPKTICLASPHLLRRP